MQGHLGGSRTALAESSSAPHSNFAIVRAPPGGRRVTTQIQGWGAIAIAIVFVAFRLLTIGNSNDPDLHEAIKAELANDLGNQVGQALDAQSGAYSAEDLRRINELANRDAITVFSTKVSKPLLSMGSSEKVIVKVRYRLPEQETREEYWRFSHSGLAGWRYRGRSSAISYYLNFT